jgi:hypothetical protein
MTFSSLKRLLLVVAVLAVIGGSVIAAIAASQPTSFAWIAGASMLGEMFTFNSPVIVAPMTRLGFAIVTLGLLAAAFWAGLIVGQRRSKQ